MQHYAFNVSELQHNSSTVPLTRQLKLDKIGQSFVSLCLLVNNQCISARQKHQP